MKENKRKQKKTTENRRKFEIGTGPDGSHESWISKRKGANFRTAARGLDIFLSSLKSFGFRISF